MESPNNEVTDTVPEQEDYFEYLFWILTGEENLPYLQSINVQVGEYTGSTYLNCLVPKWAIQDMWENWGELQFGLMQEDHGDDTEQWHANNAAKHCAIVLAHFGKKEIPLLVQMGFMKKPAAVRIAA